MSVVDLSLDRGLPAAVEAERSILGSCLLDNDLSNEALADLKPEYFFLDGHRRIFTVMAWLAEHGRPIDIVTLTQTLRDRKELDAVGGAGSLAELTDGVPRRSSVAHYIAIVRDKWNARQLLHGCNSTIGQLLEQTETVADAASELQSCLMQTFATGKRERTVLEIGQAAIARIAELRKNRGLVGFTTANPRLDKFTRGFRRKHMSILAARTKEGKTALMTQMAGANLDQGHKSVVFSVEMPGEEIFDRMVAQRTEIPYDLIQSPYGMTDAQERLYDETVANLIDRDLDVRSSSGVDIDRLCIQLKQAAMAGYELGYIDYLQLIRCAKYTKMYDKVLYISGRIRDTADETGMALVALAQLSRPPKGEENNPPMKFDIKHCGDVENDAAAIALIYRRREKNDLKQVRYSGKDDLILDANRFGMCCYAPVTYLSNLTFGVRDVIGGEEY